VHPRTGFQVASVHSIEDSADIIGSLARGILQKSVEQFSQQFHSEMRKKDNTQSRLWNSSWVMVLELDQSQQRP
jgi:uncharacterized protein (UPF0303 family)